MTAASVGPAVQAACQKLRGLLIDKAVADPNSPLHAVPRERATIDDGWLIALDESRRREGLAALAGRAGTTIEATAEARPADDAKKFATHSFGAVFVEVNVDRDLGEIRVPRVVATYDVGRRLNAKTALSQLRGGIVWGISMALLEHTIVDSRVGRIVNANLAEYHVPVNADIQEIDVTFVDNPDVNFNPLGIRGIGEIGITGVAGAVSNAVFHATGRRIRDLPITLDKLIV
jgi:xanthine dehydrogenase YagR molybdenum-binding subunit